MQIENFSERFFPEFYKEYAPRLIAFFSEFVKYLELPDNPVHRIDNLMANHDIDMIVDEYLHLQTNELLAEFPNMISADLRLLMKNIIQFYITKGSVQSYEFLFKALYNEHVKITYPKDDILRTSDGKWLQPSYISFKNDLSDDEMAQLVDFKITGMESKASGYITSIIEYNAYETPTTKLSVMIENAIGEFIPDEHVFLQSENIEVVYTIEQTKKDEGYFKNTDGMLSMDKVLQDSYFYQDFSYVINSKVAIADYREIVKKLVHPAGMIFFGAVQYYDDSDIMDVKFPVMLRQWLLFIYSTIKAPEISFNSINYEIISKKEAYIQSKKTMDYLMSDESVLNFMSEKFIENTAMNIELAKNINSVICFSESGEFINPNNVSFINNNINIPDFFVYSLLTRPVFPMIEAEISESGFVAVGSYVDYFPIVFLNGLKLEQTQIYNISKSGFYIRNASSGTVIVYFVSNNTTSKTASISEYNKNNSVAFVSGKLDYFVNEPVVAELITFDFSDFKLLQRNILNNNNMNINNLKYNNITY